MRAKAATAVRLGNRRADRAKVARARAGVAIRAAGPRAEETKRANPIGTETQRTEDCKRPVFNLPFFFEAVNAMSVASEPSADPYAELAELAGGFIHEIKNHVSTLGLNLQLLAEDFQDPQSQRERRALDRVSRLQNECQRLVDVSNDFLRLARVKDLDFQPTSLRQLIEELVD